MDDFDASGKWRMPAEWEAHERCLMGWPARAEVWGEHFASAKLEYVETAAAISRFEPVTMVAAPADVAEARAQLPGSVEVLELPLDDSWMRDCGPIFIVDDAGARRGVDFRFNAWGEKYAPYDKDDAISAALLSALGVERVGSEMILEGGALTVDGEGTLITTEQCLLHPNRNPSLSREQIEAELRRTLGVSTIVWLKWGLAEDEETNGHVDGVCTYVRPGVVIAQTCDDPRNPNHELMAENLEILRGTRDARGRRIEVMEQPQLPYFDVDGEEISGS